MRLWRTVALLLFAGCVAIDAQAQGTISIFRARRR